MKATIDGKRYNTETCERLASFDHSNNGNYSGTSALYVAKDGVLLVKTTSNGQDLYLHDNLAICENPAAWLEGVELDDIEEERVIELGILEAV